MTAETLLSTEERLRQLLHHLGIDQAHFAGWSQQDWTGLVTTYPEVVSSLTLINAFDPGRVEHLAARLLVVTGDQGPVAETVRSAMNRVAAAHHVCLSNYNISGGRTWPSSGRMSSAMQCFSFSRA
jgi:pimeloyl-ACP methyl ester carboxylesterase